MIWPGLPAFLVQLALGLCRPLPVHMPAWYSYGGIIAPTPTNMEKEGCPYALMACEDPDLYDGKNCVMYQFSGIPSVEDGAFKAWDTDLIVRSYHVRGNVWKKESSFTIAKGTSAKARYTNFVWSNFDLYTMDAQLLLTASEFLPATDYTTTLFEGDVATAVEDYIITNPGTGQQYPYTLNGAHAVIADSAMLDSYGLLRITVDEVPVGYKIQSLMLGDYAGNLWLTDAEQKDTGGGFGVLSFGLTGETIFLTREPGTYHVKVEKIERRAQKKEPVAYLYNGVRLPKLPKTDYPYEMLVQNTQNGGCVLLCMANPAKRVDSNLYPIVIYAPYIACNATADGYGEFTNYDADGNIAVLYKPIWANFDVLNADGTVYLAASEPVPVYE